MRRIIPLALSFLVSCGTAEERAVQDALYMGGEAYADSLYQEAADAYSKAAFDPQVSYALGNALYQQALYDSAVIAYQGAIEGLPAGELGSSGAYNLGNGWLQRAMVADSLSRTFKDKAAQLRIDGPNVSTKVRQAVQRDSLRTAGRNLEHLVDSALAQGLESYKSALRTSPGDEDARHNLALAQHRIALRKKASSDGGGDQDGKKELSERAKLILAQADSLVERYQFNDALIIMRQGIQADPTLQQEQEYMNKLDVVTKAATE